MESPLFSGKTGRRSVNSALAAGGRDPRPLVAFLNPGGISPEAILKRSGILGTQANNDVVVRPRSYGHSDDAPLFPGESTGPFSSR